MYIKNGFCAATLSNDWRSAQTSLGSAASRIVDVMISSRGCTRVDTSARWPARIISGIDTKTSAVNVEFCSPFFTVNFRNKIPSQIPANKPTNRRGRTSTAHNRVSVPVVINTISETIVERIAAAAALLGFCATIAIAKPAPSGTRKNITSPIACVPGISANKKPTSPSTIPVNPPARTPFAEFFQSCISKPL